MAKGGKKALNVYITRSQTHTHYFKIEFQSYIKKGL